VLSSTVPSASDVDDVVVGVDAHAFPSAADTEWVSAMIDDRKRGGVGVSLRLIRAGTWASHDERGEQDGSRVRDPWSDDDAVAYERSVLRILAPSVIHQYEGSQPEYSWCSACCCNPSRVQPGSDSVTDLGSESGAQGHGIDRDPESSDAVLPENVVVTSPLTFILLSTLNLLEIAARFVANVLSNDAAARLRPGDDDAPPIAFATARQLLLPHLGPWLCTFIILCLATYRHCNNQRLSLTESRTSLVMIILMFSLNLLLLRTAWFGAICYAFDGILANGVTLVIGMLLVAEFAKEFPSLWAVILVALVVGALSTNGIYGAFLVELFAGESFMNASITSCAGVLPSDAADRYQSGSHANALESTLVPYGALFIITFAFLMILMQADADWLSGLSMKAGEYRVKLEQKGRTWALKAASRVLPVYFVEYLFGVLERSRDALQTPQAAVLAPPSAEEDPLRIDVSNQEHDAGTALISLPPNHAGASDSLPDSVVVTRMLARATRAVSGPVSRTRMRHLDGIALVAVRLSQLSSTGSIAGPRAVYSQLRGLGKAADRACLKFGGRRIRLLDDGVLLGFGVDSREDDGLRHAFASPCHGSNGGSMQLGNSIGGSVRTKVCRSALNAACRVVMEIEQLQVQLGIELPPQAMLHVGSIGIGLIGAFPNSLDCIGRAVDVVLQASESQLIRTGRQHRAVGMTHAFAQVLSIDRPCIGAITVPLMDSAGMGHSDRGSAASGAGSSSLPQQWRASDRLDPAMQTMVPVLHCKNALSSLVKDPNTCASSSMPTLASDIAGSLQLHHWVVHALGVPRANWDARVRNDEHAIADSNSFIASFPAMHRLARHGTDSMTVDSRWTGTTGSES